MLLCMSYTRPQGLREQFEELTDDLGVCRDPDLRREVLRRMKAVIDEADELILHLDAR